MGKQQENRLAQVTKILNVGIHSIVEFLEKKGILIEANPNIGITVDQYALLKKEFAASIATKREADELSIGGNRDSLSENSGAVQPNEQIEEDGKVIIIKSQLEDPIKKENSVTELEKKVTELEKKETENPPETISPKKPIEEKSVSNKPKLQGLKIKGKVELPSKNRSIRKKKSNSNEETICKLASQNIEEKVAVDKENNIVDLKDQPIKEKKIQEKKEEIENKPFKVEKPIIANINEKPSLEKAPVKKEKENITTADNNNKEEVKDELSQEEKNHILVSKKEINSETLSDEDKKTHIIEAKADKLQGLKVLGKIELPSEKPKKVASSDDKKRNKRKRIRKIVNKKTTQPIGRRKKPDSNSSNRDDKDKKGSVTGNKRGSVTGNKRGSVTGNKRGSVTGNKRGSVTGNKRGSVTGNKRGLVKKEEISQKDVHAQYKKTLARLSGGGNTSKKAFNKRQYRKDKRASIAAKREKLEGSIDTNILKVTEFISANELATLMEIGINDIIAKCFAMGMIVSINQRLDAEAITFITDEFDFDVEFTTDKEEIEVVEEEKDTKEDLLDRAPIVTIMGHVDHGKTSLLDFIRNAKVAEGEAGGITQHIGAYDVITDSGKRIAFLDTPGHEAFTAMRARGAKLTDIAIIVIAADDSVMPQTEEALNHAQVAGVPIIIAINKIDKPEANPDKIKEELSQKNILVEDWGGKHQCYEISAKKGTGIESLLEGVLLEAELLELKANPNKKASGTVVEATLDKGKGYVTTVLVQAGTMKVGNIILAGHYFGRVKAMTNHLGAKIKDAPPATPVQILGLNGVPQSGDRFNIMDAEKDAREVAIKREQILREQKVRTTKRTTLSELGRRIALKNFVQLNIIIKGDVDGSLEALTGSLLKLSTQEIEINIIHKGVGAISEADIHLC